MTKILVLYYSMYGHVETMSGAVAEGARGVEGTEVVIKRVPDLVPEEVARRVGAKLDQPAPAHHCVNPSGGKAGQHDQKESCQPEGSESGLHRCVSWCGQR